MNILECLSRRNPFETHVTSDDLSFGDWMEPTKAWKTRQQMREIPMQVLQ